MDSVAVCTDERTPFLHRSSPPLPHRDAVAGDEEIALPPSSSIVQPSPPLDRSQRLDSLDVFRGLTVALMVLVDDAGGAFPSLNHSPWFGVTLADFVMPFFLFGVGVSIALVFKKVTSKPTATKKVILRTMKLFFVGIVLQGGYFHGRSHLTYGVDVHRIRWMGVLQRISIGYLIGSILEIWLVTNIAVDSAMTFVKRYYVQWIFVFGLGSLYMCLLYGLYVPNWKYGDLSANLNSSSSTHPYASQLVNCGMRGSLQPPCNAVGFVDRLLLGVNHLYQHPMYRRTKECSLNSPDYGLLPQNAPNWCLAPFDPEGILSSLMAAISCIVGLHYGHIILHFKNHTQTILMWLVSSVSLLIAGYFVELLGVPLSKPLYTLSYMCVTAGTAGFVLTGIFYIVDVKHIKKPTMALQFMGMNALVIYALAACDVFPAALQGFYWRSPENNLVDGTERLLQSVFQSRKWGTLAFVMLEILLWGFVATCLHLKRIYTNFR